MIDLPPPSARLGTVAGNTFELLSPRDPAYLLLAQAARSGKLDGYSAADFLRGDRLFTRSEAAKLLESAGEVSSAGTLLLDTKRGLLPRGVVVSGVGRDGAAVVQATRFGVDAAYVHLAGKLADVTVGRRPLRWGPGWTGGLLFSDSAPSFDGVQVEKRFRMRRLGPLRFEQFYGQFFEDDVPGVASQRGTRRHLAGRRVSTDSDARWQLSIGEAIKAIRLPDPAFAAVIPWYAYEHDWTTNGTGRWLGLPRSQSFPDSFWVNYMGDITASYRDERNGTSYYSEYLLDDIKAPGGLGQGNNTPQRTGLLVGATLKRPRYSLRAEIATIDKNTYRSEAIPNYWNRGQSFLGYPAGPNAVVWFGRGDYKATEKLSLTVEGEARRKRVNDPTAYGVRRNRLTAMGTYAIDPQRFAVLRIGTDQSTFTLGWLP